MSYQFKPTVLDEVEYALHYFQESCLMPFNYINGSSMPFLPPFLVGLPSKNFCKFGSWVEQTGMAIHR